jgi:hypothetical protein
MNTTPVNDPVNAASAGPCGRVCGRWWPRSASAGTRRCARVRRASRLPAGPLRHRLQHPPDRHRAWGARPAGAGGAGPPGGAAGARPQRLAAQRRRYTEERIAARVAELGFTNVRAYLIDRVVEQGWLLADVAAGLAVHRLTVRRLLDRYGIRRVRRTPRERAAAESGRRMQAMGWQAQRAARLAELGFGDLAAYLQARHLEQGWSVKRMRAELRVGRRWLMGELARLGLRP